MLLILARHGNTFGPADTPVWVGANEDYPLVETGLEQSRQIGRAIRGAGLALDRVLAGPLKRTRIGAQLAAEQCGFSGAVEVDERLREIDYGVWGGKSDAQIEESWGPGALEDWRERSIPPRGAGWTPSPETLKAHARAVFEQVTVRAGPDDVVLIVTSNGILRNFHALIMGADAPVQEAKVKTGRLGAAQIGPHGVHPLCWNAPPETARLTP